MLAGNECLDPKISELTLGTLLLVTEVQDKHQGAAYKGAGAVLDHPVQRTLGLCA